MSDGENDFAAFEASANTPPAEAASEAKAPAEEAKEPTTDEGAEKALELTEGDEAVDAADGDEGAEEHTDEEGKKRRSRPAHLRIAQEVAKRHDIQRELDALKAKYEGGAKVEPTLARPDPAQFEFGEADPSYIDALTDWKLDSREADRAKASEANAERQQFVDKVSTGVSAGETAGKAKYTDFEAKVEAAVESRGGDPLPPLLTVAIGLSPVGGDMIYRLATDEAAAFRLEKLANGGEGSANAAAMAFGELEGEYLPDGEDADLDVSDSLDMARMLGRMRARMKGTKAAPVVTSTNAPEPPAERARGGSGRFEVGADTNDFAAFEKMANAKR